MDFRCFPLSHCPSAPTFAPPEMPEFASYIGIAGLGSDAPRLPLASLMAGMWGYDRRTRPADVSRGLSETMFLAETALDHGPWTAGGPPTVRGIDMDHRPLLGVGGQLGGLHPGGFNALFVDGSVRFLNQAIDPAVLSSDDDDPCEGMILTQGGKDTNKSHAKAQGRKGRWGKGRVGQGTMCSTVPSPTKVPRIVVGGARFARPTLQNFLFFASSRLCAFA